MPPGIASSGNAACEPDGREAQGSEFHGHDDPGHGGDGPGGMSQSIRERPSPNHDERPAGEPVDMLILHYTGMRTGR